MTRLFLVFWLVGFAAQTTDLLAIAAPDDCTEDTRGSSADPCGEGCARCLCCARVAMFIPGVAAPAAAVAPERAALLLPAQRESGPVPHAIFHVPKTPLT